MNNVYTLNSYLNVVSICVYNVIVPIIINSFLAFWVKCDSKIILYNDYTTTTPKKKKNPKYAVRTKLMQKSSDLFHCIACVIICLGINFRDYVDSSHFGRVIEVVENLTLKIQQ